MQRLLIVARVIRLSWLSLIGVVTTITVAAQAQTPASKLEGMWSDPPATAIDTFCAFSCTDVGLDRLNKLLDDPANDSRPVTQLLREAATVQDEYVKAKFTPEALQHYPLDPLKDPGYLQCQPWGLARQMFAPHQFEMRQRGKDRIELRYGEWAARRTVHMDGRKITASIKPARLGYSVGRWEGNTLVVETSGIQPDIFEAFVPATGGVGTLHSAQLRIVERYSRSPDGKTLRLTATLEDPATFREPLVLKKVWRWAPDQKIAPYDSCEKPKEKAGAKP